MAEPAIELCQRYGNELVIAFELQKEQFVDISFQGDVNLAEAMFKDQFADTDVGFALHMIKELR